MRHAILPAALALIALPAWADQYLVLPDLKTAQDRSAVMCVAMGCDGIHTKWWWPVIELKDGTAAVVVGDDKTAYAATHPTKNRGLDGTERGKLKTEADVAPLKPVPVDPAGVGK